MFDSGGCMKSANLDKALEIGRFRNLLIILIIASLFFLPVVVYYTGGTKTVYVHFLYFPIILSARSTKVVYVMAVALIATFLLGPFMPADVGINEMQSLQSWLVRGGMYLFVGIVVYLLNSKSRRDLSISRLVLHSFKEGVCIIDNSDTIIFTNRTFAKLHSKSVNDIIRMNIYDFMEENYSDIHRTSEYLKLEQAIKHRYSERRLMIPRKINPYGSIVTEYNVDTLENQDLNGCIIVVNNIEDRLEYEKNLYHLSYTDALTGVKNRRAFQKYLGSVDQSKVLPLGILLVDVDGIKFINDSFGHQKGDELIILLASIISNVVRKYGYTARYDGDEFIAVVDNATTNLLDTIVERICNEVSLIEINSLGMSVSCGYGLANTLDEVQEVLKIAENNMYLDKNSSKNSIRNNPLDTIMNTLHEKDVYSEEHSKSVSYISENIARVLLLPGCQIKEVSHAGLLHDIGKIIVPLDILTKEGSLTDEEMNKMKEHPAIGFRLLSSVKNLNSIPEMIYSHHERWDGMGYPNQVKGFDIPLGARIISVADSFNAMTTDRSYRTKFTNEEALTELIRCKGSQFDPIIVDAFAANFETIIN